ncbi:hypothetical protein GFP94_06905 [Salmonella enterica]|uniref:hypothetical protein n=1 Tax=Salmonella enterica TaxID=28901 RepID=UPI0009AA1249|nr:hypothetical protein [Salmonella enterica]EAC0344846.1 hypothetical protein [Salmonella enterica subsp. enterica serovar Newport]EDM1758019.1 hypothetical protein [Salmonella enterica subsp. diarizonae]EEN4101267.1 hypothetical protein [Salmonella enterica subsp. enterica serovar Mikawasima]EGF4901750.1 hypothetical protein [Salmonella enterica subsp. enterica serovar Bredeney]EBS2914765.1 hypothetical protein [Salmonella enterica subsp. enterica serovar Newport]
MIINVLEFLLRFVGACMLGLWLARWFISRYLDKDHLLTLYAEWMINEVKRRHGVEGCARIKFRDGYNVFVFSSAYRVFTNGDDWLIELRNAEVSDGKARED